MRIRQIKPSWFTDKALQTGARADDREFYIGLWMLADDDGWFEWDPDSIGVALYGFLPLGRREARIARHADVLRALDVEQPHLVVHVCGHAQVPKMPQHQRISEAKRVTTDHRKHMAGDCPAAPRGTPRTPAPPRPGTGSGTVVERNGSDGAHAHEEPTSIQARLGTFEELMAAVAGGGGHPLRVSQRPSGDSRPHQIRVSRSPGEGEQQ